MCNALGWYSSRVTNSLVERGIISASSARYRDETLVKPRVHKLRILQQGVCKQDRRSAATDKMYERTLGRCEEDHVASKSMLGPICYHYFDLTDHKFTIYLQVSITTIIFPYVTRLEAHLALHQTHHAAHVHHRCKSSAFILGCRRFQCRYSNAKC